VVIKEMRVIFEDRPDGDIVYTLDSKEELANMKNHPFVLKEGTHYKIRVTFRVQHDIVSGLKYVNTVYRKGIRGMLYLLVHFTLLSH
jgi:Rho GDP-dissociation inhibitor